MTKVISFLILTLAVFASAEETCNEGTKYFSYGGKLAGDKSVGSLCDCIQERLIATGTINKTTPYVCSKNDDFSSVEFRKADDENVSRAELGCRDCLEETYKTEGDKTAVCDSIDKSNQEGDNKRVARRGFYYETGVIVAISWPPLRVRVTVYELLIVWDRK